MTSFKLFLSLFENVIITINRPTDLFLINIYNFVRNWWLECGVSFGPELIKASLVCVGYGNAEHAFTFRSNKLVNCACILQSYKPCRNRVGCP